MKPFGKLRTSQESRPFSFLIVAFVILMMWFSTASVFAQDLNTAEVVSSETVDYQLSYPGLLPDHPLYFLKTGRDRIMSFFISKPLEKAEFNLLQADKRVEASYMLSKKGESKIDLAQSTFSKAENYFEDAINNTLSAKTQGINTEEFSNKLHQSNKKHQQIIKDITKSLNKNNKKKFAVEHERLVKFEKKVKDLNRR